MLAVVCTDQVVKAYASKWARQSDVRRSAARSTVYRLRRPIIRHCTLRGALNRSVMGLGRGASTAAPCHSPCCVDTTITLYTLQKRGNMECNACRAPLDRRGNGFKPLPPTNRRHWRPATRSRAGQVCRVVRAGLQQSGASGVTLYEGRDPPRHD